MKITTEKIVRYYVEEGGSIYGGPFYDRAEAVACLRDYRRFHGRTLARDREDRAIKRKQAKP